MKKSIAVIILSLTASLFAQINLGLLTGPSSIPAAYLIENVVSIENQDLAYEAFSGPQQLVPKMLKGEVDIGFMPPNVAAKVYNSSEGKLLCVAVTGYGNLSIITKDPKISRLSDLKNKTLYVAGQGATPEYMIKYLLKKNKIDVNEKNGVTLDFSIPASQLAAMIVSGKIEYALVPEPFATIASLQDSSVFSAINLQNEYEKIQGKGETYPLTVMVVTKDFAYNKTSAMNQFLELYKESYLWTVENGLDAGLLYEELGLGLKAGVVSNSIPNCNFTFQPARDARKEIENILKIFIKEDKASVGENLPGKDFYY